MGDEDGDGREGGGKECGEGDQEGEETTTCAIAITAGRRLSGTTAEARPSASSFSSSSAAATPGAPSSASSASSSPPGEKTVRFERRTSLKQRVADLFRPRPGTGS